MKPGSLNIGYLDPLGSGFKTNLEAALTFSQNPALRHGEDLSPHESRTLSPTQPEACHDSLKTAGGNRTNRHGFPIRGIPAIPVVRAGAGTPFLLGSFHMEDVFKDNLPLRP